MLEQEGLDQIGLVAADVVADDVDLTTPGLAGEDVFEEGDELLARAWIAVFSSTQNTAACAGGFRYSPITPAALASKSGSLETMWVSSRCGRTPCLRQMRCTAENDTSPSSATNLRPLQCVEPSRGRCFRVRSSTRASSKTLCIERRRPTRDERVVAGQLGSNVDAALALGL